MYNITNKQKGCDTMAPQAQAILNANMLDNSFSEQDAIHALYTELEKGVQSMKNGEVCTIDEAWEEIDKI